MRRIAARATNMTHESQMDIVARVAVGADQIGVDEIYIFNEPFRISSQALAWVDLKANIRSLDLKLNHDERDTEHAMHKLKEAGVHTVVALGGDGTHRIIARCAPELNLIPLSTGTNNVFPVNVEPTIAGMAAALAAKNQLPTDDPNLMSACKILRLRLPSGCSDVGLIDVVLLKNDFVGNFLPYDSTKIMEMVLTCALPDSIGMSPIGGFVKIVEKRDDFGLHLKLGRGHAFHAPISPGYFQPIATQSVSKVSINQTVELRGPGTIALDGDRAHRLDSGQKASVTLHQDGPTILHVPTIMRHAVEASILST